MVRILLRRSSHDPAVERLLDALFPLEPRPDGLARSLLVEAPALLEEAYLVAFKANASMDYDLAYLGMLLDRDPQFIARYLEAGDHPAKPLAFVRDVDITPLWLRADYEAVFTTAVEHIHEMGGETYALQNLFVRRESRIDDEAMSARQDSLISRLIEARGDDADFMAFLFGAVTVLSHERRRSHLAAFVAKNPSLAAFERIPLEPSFWSSSGGSLVPVLQANAEFLESIVPLLRGPALLLHRHRIERKIASIRAWIESQKRSDFVGW